MIQAKLQCPAKVNLFLEVTGRRPDGYHNLATIFAKISLFDGLEICPQAEGPVEFAMENRTGFQIPEGPENLVVRAAEAFRKTFRIGCGVRIALQKNIPPGAGLGGGSSDAAGTLVGMARAFELDRSMRTTSLRAALRRLAGGLGADVPFFQQDAPFCVGRGIGDRLRPAPMRKALPWMLLVYPRVSVATAGVYRLLDGSRRAGVLTRLAQLGKLQKKLETGRPVGEWAGLLFNRLEEAVLPDYPEISQAKRILRQLGVQGVLMSGSGSSVFGFVRSHEEGEQLRGRLRGYPWDVYVTCCMG